MKRREMLRTVLTSFILSAATLLAQNAHPPEANADKKPIEATAGSPRNDLEGGFPVELDHRALIVIHAPLGGYSAEQRAAGIQDRLIAFARNSSIPVDSVKVEDQPYWSQIKIGNDTLMWVSEGDAQRAGLTRQLLAAQSAEIIRHAVTLYRKEHTWPNFFRGLLYSFLVTVCLILALYALSRVYRWIRGGLERWVEAAQAKLAIRSKLRLPGAYLGPPLLMLIGIVRWGVVLLLLDAYLTLLLGFFAGTREIARTLSDWFVSHFSAVSQQIAGYLPNLLIVIVIGILTFYLIKLSGFFFGEIGAGRLTVRGFYPDWANPTAKLLRALIIVLAAIIVFPYLPGSKSPAFQGISIFVGVLLSLGSSSAVANAVAGTILTYMRSFQIGDYVEIGTTKGEVVEKTLLVTRIRTPKQEIVTIPNGTVMTASVTNYSVQAEHGGVILYSTVTIGYDAPWRQVHELLIKAALSTPRILSDPRPFVLQTSLDDFYVSYQLNAYTDQPRLMPQIYSDLHQNIQDKFNEAGVEIMSPHYSQLRDGNQTTTPADYLPSDYVPTAFRMQSASDNTDVKNNGASEKRKAG